jgi:hypothetical protein
MNRLASWQVWNWCEIFTAQCSGPYWQFIRHGSLNTAAWPAQAAQSARVPCCTSAHARVSRQDRTGLRTFVTRNVRLISFQILIKWDLFFILKKGENSILKIWPVCIFLTFTLGRNVIFLYNSTRRSSDCFNCLEVEVVNYFNFLSRQCTLMRWDSNRVWSFRFWTNWLFSEIGSLAKLVILIIKSSRATSRVKWLSEEKAKVSRTISVSSSGYWSATDQLVAREDFIIQCRRESYKISE